MYDSNPEDQSIMLLTLFELWVALDRLAVANCPLLLDYSPEVTPTLLEPLLLRQSKSFDRVARIRQYLRERHNRAIYGSIFTDTVNSETFAVRYFNRSLELGTLKESIEAAATQKRKEKKEELQAKNARYQELKASADRLDHSCFITREGRRVGDPRCLKCSHAKQARSLKIAIHEWPLPNEHLQAKVVVFELHTPPVFQVWRTTTYELLRDICTPPHVPVRKSIVHVRLSQYSGLRNHITSSSIGRISLASTEKSFEKSHYKGVKIPSSEASVLLNNGLRFRLHATMASSSSTDG
ncbi:hypothetical protein BS47DRAFT_1456812 [Hydnum rufescens UP504]|uniref:Uncharacterized protein n=1 Tax=Hydnum rufescens UP504 TaxID=1448309 RepID=A0A9P6DFQ2_9AGAM|nr:hypothetical protein BS47DRAFT_1456812 [Hydnum rufescens UP504]